MYLAVLLLFVSAAGWASCGSASCPIDTRSVQETTRGDIRLGYEFEFIDQDQPRISTRKASVGEIHGHHDEVRTINRLHRFSVGAGITDRLWADVSIPVVAMSHRHIHHHMGEEMVEGWNFTDLGDLAIRGRYAVLKPEKGARPTVSLIAGLELPTGKSHENNADGEHAEPSMTPGSDSWDWLAGVSTLQHFSVPMVGGEFGQMPLFFSLTHQWNGKGVDDYRRGRTLGVNAGVVYPVRPWVGVMSQLNLLVRGKDDAGSTGEEVEKTGGEFLYYSPGLQFRIGGHWEAYTLVQIPLRQRVNRIQLTSDYNLQTGVSYRFHL